MGLGVILEQNSQVIAYISRVDENRKARRCNSERMFGIGLHHQTVT